MRNNVMTPNTKTLLGAKNDTRFFDRKCGGGVLFIYLILSYLLKTCSFHGGSFLKDKRTRKDVVLFSVNLMNNIFALYYDLKHKRYRHGGYDAFKINDPKPRDIHKATVKDRLVHHALYRILYPYFDSQFIYDSYSCRVDKGTHKALNRFQTFARMCSVNHKKTCFVLKCDIRKFFANIDHAILKSILARHVSDKDTLSLLDTIIDSFHTEGVVHGVGLPLGNLTSQLLVNVYMNEFDQYMKHVLKTKYYIRYADDFVILSQERMYLEEILENIRTFLKEQLHLELHPNKVFIKTIASGVDFLGWVHFPKHRVLRTATKRRMYKNLQKGVPKNALASYLGLLNHGNGFSIKKDIKRRFV